MHANQHLFSKFAIAKRVFDHGQQAGGRLCKSDKNVTQVHREGALVAAARK